MTGPVVTLRPGHRRMIRVLASILAIVAVLLGVILRQPLFFIAAAVLVLIAVAAFVLVLRRRNRAAQEVVGLSDEREDLKSLGILEIRPREKTPRSEAEEAEAPGEAASPPGVVSDGAPAPEPVLSPPAETETTAHNDPEDTMAERESSQLRVRQKDPATFVAVESAAADQREDVLVPVLHALRAALGAHTVCLLRREVPALRYHIEVIVSQNSFARSHGRFVTRVPFYPERGDGVVLRQVEAEDLPAACLGYYREPIAIRQVAVLPVDGASYLLLADAREEGGLDGERPRTLLLRFARLLETLLDAGEPADEAPVRPRREIIAEEMDQARKGQHPLALALVYYSGADGLVDTDPGAVAEAEETLRECLTEVAPGVRIERFGELTFGLFYRGEDPAFDAWAVRVQKALDTHPRLDGGIRMGVALMQDRHTGPDAFKEEVTAALLEAYESGQCVIIE